MQAGNDGIIRKQEPGKGGLHTMPTPGGIRMHRAETITVPQDRMRRGEVAEGDFTIAEFIAVAVVIFLIVAVTLFWALWRSPERSSSQTSLPPQGKADEAHRLATGASSTAESPLLTKGADIGDSSLGQDVQDAVLIAQVVFTPLLAGWAIWAGMAASARSSDVRVAQQLGMLASLPPLVLTALMSLGVIHATFALATVLAVALLAIDLLGWRVVSWLFDRERLVTGGKPLSARSARGSGSEA